MNKLIYVVKGVTGETTEIFKNRIFVKLENLTKTSDILGLRLTITDLKPPALSVIPFSKTKIAVISVKTQMTSPIDGLIKMDGFEGVYQVEEAIPVSYHKTWPDREATPGIGLLTLFRKKKNLDYEKFINRWHNGHTPLSLKIHPLWNYNRNVVKEEMSGSKIWFDGIVEEHCKTRSDLLNPFRFFGNPLIIIPRMIKVYRDVKSFIDYKSIETYLVNEYILKS